MCLLRGFTGPDPHSLLPTPALWRPRPGLPTSPLWLAVWSLAARVTACSCRLRVLQAVWSECVVSVQPGCWWGGGGDLAVYFNLFRMPGLCRRFLCSHYSQPQSLPAVGQPAPCTVALWSICLWDPRNVDGTAVCCDYFASTLFRSSLVEISFEIEQRNEAEIVR